MEPHRGRRVNARRRPVYMGGLGAAAGY